MQPRHAFTGLAVSALVLATAAAAKPRVAKVVESGRAPCGAVALNGALWVANYDSGTIVRIDPRSNRVTRTIRLGRTGCWLDAGAGALWVARDGAAAVVRIDARTFRQESIRVDSVPFDADVAFGSVWVTSFAEGTVVRIDPRTRKIVRRFALGGNATAVEPGFGSIWVGFGRNATSVARIDPATNAFTRVPVGQRAPGRFAMSRSAVWVTTDEHTTVRIDPATNRVVATLRTGQSPAQPAVAPDGTIWVPAKASNTVSRIDPVTNRVVDSFAAGPGALTAVRAFGSMWVTSFAGTDVWRFTSS